MPVSSTSSEIFRMNRVAIDLISSAPNRLRVDSIATFQSE